MAKYSKPEISVVFFDCEISAAETVSNVNANYLGTMQDGTLTTIGIKGPSLTKQKQVENVLKLN